MENGYNTMSFCLAERDVDDVWYDIRDFLKMLVKYDYDATISFDGLTIIIEYDHAARKGFGNETPHWITEDEWWDVLSAREEQKKESEKEKDEF